MTRRILLFARPGRSDLLHTVGLVADRLREADIRPVLMPTDPTITEWTTGQDASAPDPADVSIPDELVGRVDLADPADPSAGCELVCVLGGDGTILRAAEAARAGDIPLLGVNFGHVGFLAEAEQKDLSATVDRIAARDYHVEDRMTLDVSVYSGSERLATSWALNEVTVEKAERERMLELTLEVDGRPISTWGCDGVIVSTPSGSTAYAFSAGGPIVWPDVQAMLLVPISAHALFARPLVVGPQTKVAVELVPANMGRGVMWCDGARPLDLPDGARIEVSHGTRPVRLARFGDEPFADRLVHKFHLPVDGWRGEGRKQAGDAN
ncbi:NAD kinase [Mobilicoccus pelagius]|uniref:NAD kinase n=1 Tax=Mobilicoccus pelagius NBRC 104925 TaxID=1089455 RepID=H5UV70_9MICO|nr:NAD kinase [Mobilicoccus pelagius]GAB49628.1 putative inorganic polyphosphate/ATP-NAD kinase [Mobilicoccus pelagius NBRC 104925]